MNTDDEDLPNGEEKTSGTEEYAMGSGISLRSQGWPERFERWMQLRNWSAQTQATYRAGLQSLLAFLESQGVQEIQRLSLELLERYRLHLFEKRYRGKPLKLATQSVRLTAAKAFTRFLRQTNVLLLDVGADLELPKVPRGLPRVLSEDEAMRLVEAPDVSRPAGVRDRAMLEVFYASGARNSELGRLQLPDIDWDQQALWIRQGKGGKDRLVPLGEEALAWLEEYLESTKIPGGGSGHRRRESSLLRPRGDWKTNAASGRLAWRWCSAGRPWCSGYWRDPGGRGRRSRRRRRRANAPR